MMNQNDKNFLWLNREGKWLGAHWDGLEIAADGSLQLAPLALGNAADSQTLAGLPGPDGPAGIAVDALGVIYFSEPEKNRVLVIDACDGSQRPLPCLGEGSGLAQLSEPRSLAWSTARQALLIVDSGNHRIQVVNPLLGQVVEIWGHYGSAPGEFDTPWTIAAGADGSFYVVDYGNVRVQKFNAVGDVVPQFWQNAAAAKVLTQPAGVAAGQDDGAVRVYVLDATAHAVFVFDREGHAVRDDRGNPLSFGAGQLRQPMGLAAIGNNVFVGDNALRQVLQFDGPPWRFRGAAVGYQGPVAALAAGASGTLLVLPGANTSPLTLQVAKAYARQGVFWSVSITTQGKVGWHRLAAVCGELATDAHLQLFFHTSNSQGDAPAPPQLQADGSNPFTDTKWCAKPADVTDVFLGGGPGAYLWCGAWFSGDGLATPVVSQMRVEFNHETYLAELPGVYRQPACNGFLLRFLSLLETFNQETEDTIHNLPALFDPYAAPAAYLPWLADWLAVDLEEDWDEAKVRRAIATAFASYSQIGTPTGLRAALKEYAGVDAIIEEPLLHAAWWALPAPVTSPCGEQPSAPVTWQDTGNSILGYTTMLAPAETQGAVVGTTAVLDQSHLIQETDFGVPLFEDVAFQFSVLVYRGQLNCPATQQLAVSLIENWKPAHTAYQLCILEAQMRVGFQARVGIETLVAGPPPAVRLGESVGLGVGTLLGGQATGRIGAQSQLGVTTLMG